jgi:hypothetical protein
LLLLLNKLFVYWGHLGRMDDRKMKNYAYRVYACGTQGNLENLRPIRPICPLSHLIAHRPHLLR